MVMFTLNAWVWYEHPTLSWIPVKLLQQSGDQIVVKDQANEQYTLEAKPDYLEVHPSSLKHVDNMVAMEELTEAAILHNLRLRYDEDLIYTYISSILVSINPFKQMPIYSPAVMKDYRFKLANHQFILPHVYALADNAFKFLSLDRKDQSVIISGESGAGKTEATKLVLQYMAEMSGQGSDVEQQLLEANPIIEAFGNAKTVRNNNSSRFGKWVQILFDGKLHIVGAKIDQYLLEKSRIIMPGPGERNYHLFYQLCAGLSPAERQRYRVDHASSFRICASGDTIEIEGVDDAAEFKDMKAAMSVLKFAAEEIDHIVRTAAAVMHLGNIEFVAQGEQAHVRNKDQVALCAEIMQCDHAALDEALVSQWKQMGRENIKTFRNKAQADAGRDALCKAVYSHMFVWLIDRINKTLYVSKPNMMLVGVLDIFGFEIFQTNRFEQFCINLANEKMQQHFNEHIFTMEQSEYRSDNIDVAHVEFVDNQPCLDVLEKGAQSVLGMVDEEIRLPKGSDSNLLDRLNAAYKASRYYAKSRTGQQEFSIRHYAGVVDYVVEGFMDKNKDQLEVNVAQVVCQSKNPFIAKVLPADLGKMTVGTRFRQQLTLLMDTLKKTTPHFIRCIKPNNLKVSDTFDAPMVVRQLRYLGIREVVNIRQLGYPIRRLHADFFKRYSALVDGGFPAPKSSPDYKSLSAALLNKLGAVAVQWRVGNTKVFLKNSLQSELEAKREKKITKVAIKLQSRWRARMWRKRYLRLKGALANLRKAMQSDSYEMLDKAIEDVESLRFKTNPQLMQEALRVRNLLYEQAQARRALESATKTRDVDLIRTAISAAEKSKMKNDFPLLVQARDLLSSLTSYLSDLKVAIDKRDLSLIVKVLETAGKLGMNGPKEKEAAALKEQLEEETRLKAALQAAMQNRDLEALKHALQVAMSAKSGVMVGVAMQRAMAAGLADDPVVKQALAMQSSLEQEVTAFKMASELQAAIKSEDYDILKATIELAMSKGFKTHNLTVQAQALMDNLAKKEGIINQLKAALGAKDEARLTAAIVASEQLGFKSMVEYNEAVKMRDHLRSVKSALSNASKKDGGADLDVAVAEALALGIEQKDISSARAMRDSMAANKEVVNALEAAVSARDANLLAAAIAKAKQSSLPSSHALMLQATELLTELTQQNDAMKQELASAEAQTADGEKKAERRRSIITGAVSQSTLSEADSAAERELLSNFDRSKYSSDIYSLARYPELRTPSQFAEDSFFNKKNLKATMLVFSKEVIPKSLTKLDDDTFLNGLAVELFKMIQGFQGDRHYSFPDTLVAELIDQVLIEPLLRNEVYVQLMKQLSRNPKEDSAIKGWMLFCLLCESVPPSTNFLYFVLHFIDTHLESPADDVPAFASQYAAYALHTLKDTVVRFKFIAPKRGSDAYNEREANKGKPGRAFVSVDHVAAFRERTMVPAHVLFSYPDGSQSKMLVTPWLKNEVLLPKLAASIGLKDCSGIAVFEMRGLDLRYIYPHECVLDFQFQWDKQIRKEEVQKKAKGGFFGSLFSKKKKEEAPPQASSSSSSTGPDGTPEIEDVFVENAGARRFLVKRQLHARPVGESSDLVAQRLMMQMTAREIVWGYHALSEEEAAARLLAVAASVNALPLLGPLPVPAAENGGDLFLTTTFSDAPVNLVHAKKTDAKRFAKMVEKFRGEIGGGQDANSFNEAVRKMPTFGAQFYKVQRNDECNLKTPDEVVLAVNYYGVYVLDVKTRATLYHYTLLQVLGWSHSPVRVVVKVKLEEKGNTGTATLKFNTHNPRMGKEVCDLLLAYANEMLKSVQSGRK